MSNDEERALPQVGETWEKRSFPLPTVVQIVGRHGDGTLTAKYGRRCVTLPVELFVGQGFERYGAADDKEVSRG